MVETSNTVYGKIIKQGYVFHLQFSALLHVAGIQGHFA